MLGKLSELKNIETVTRRGAAQSRASESFSEETSEMNYCRAQRLFRGIAPRLKLEQEREASFVRSQQRENVRNRRLGAPPVRELGESSKAEALGPRRSLRARTTNHAGMVNRMRAPSLYLRRLISLAAPAQGEKLEKHSRGGSLRFASTFRTTYRA